MTRFVELDPGTAETLKLPIPLDERNEIVARIRAAQHGRPAAPSPTEAEIATSR